MFKFFISGTRVNQKIIKVTRSPLQLPPIREDKKCIKFSFGDVTPVEGKKNISIATGAYEMSQWPHGVAVIINNEMFLRQNTREGTDIDEKNLAQVLHYLGYKVEVHKNCSAKDIMDIVEENGKCDHSRYDSFICCILSHGSNGGIFGTDSYRVPLCNISEKLNEQNCKSLAEKPKIFFLQCDCDTAELSSGNFYYSFASARGHNAWRNIDEGAWYITELCRALATHARYASLNDMMDVVNAEVKKYENEGYRQVTKVDKRTNKDIFFF